MQCVLFLLNCFIVFHCKCPEWCCAAIDAHETKDLLVRGWRVACTVMHHVGVSRILFLLLVNLAKSPIRNTERASRQSAQCTHIHCDLLDVNDAIQSLDRFARQNSNTMCAALRHANCKKEIHSHVRETWLVIESTICLARSHFTKCIPVDCTLRSLAERKWCA